MEAASEKPGYRTGEEEESRNGSRYTYGTARKQQLTWVFVQKIVLLFTTIVLHHFLAARTSHGRHGNGRILSKTFTGDRHGTSRAQTNFGHFLVIHIAVRVIT